MPRPNKIDPESFDLNEFDLVLMKVQKLTI